MSSGDDDYGNPQREIDHLRRTLSERDAQIAALTAERDRLRGLLTEACYSMDRCGLLSHVDRIRAALNQETKHDH